jgi:hypothetical protein
MWVSVYEPHIILMILEPPQGRTSAPTVQKPRAFIDACVECGEVQ